MVARGFPDQYLDQETGGGGGGGKKWWPKSDPIGASNYGANGNRGDGGSGGGGANSKSGAVVQPTSYWSYGWKWCKCSGNNPTTYDMDLLRSGGPYTWSRWFWWWWRC